MYLNELQALKHLKERLFWLFTCSLALTTSFGNEAFGAFGNSVWQRWNRKLDRIWRQVGNYEEQCSHKNWIHSFVVSSAPTILQPWVRIPSTPSTLFSICDVKKTKINEKEVGFGPYLKKWNLTVLHTSDLQKVASPEAIYVVDDDEQHARASE